MESEYAKLSVPEKDPQCGRAARGEPLIREYGEMFSRMQGKRVAFAGDSLMDMVVFPFLCSAPELGWSSADEPVGNFSGRADDEAWVLAKRFTKPGMQPIVIAHMRFWNFVQGEKNVKVSHPFNIPLTPPTFDVLFLNAAHNALDWPEKDFSWLAARLLRQAELEAAHFGRVVFIGHPPQHFDTPTGQYKGAQSVPCVCRDDAALEQQAAFKNNAILEKLVKGHPDISRYVSPWHDYKDWCMKHPLQEMGGNSVWHSVDCTHFPYDDYEMHAPFLKKMLGIAGL
jgi:hypothetical protein